MESASLHQGLVAGASWLNDKVTEAAGGSESVEEMANQFADGIAGTIVAEGGSQVMELAQATVENADLGDFSGYVPEGTMDDLGKQVRNYTMQA